MEFIKQKRCVNLVLLGLLTIACGGPDEPTAKTNEVVGSVVQNLQGATQPFLREQRLSRFSVFLAERRSALVQLGAQLGNPPATGAYPYTGLLDPRTVTNRYSYAVSRYDSYLRRISDQMVSENLVQRSVSFGTLEMPPGFVKPEQFKAPGALNDDDAFWHALRAGDGCRIWLTPRTTYFLTKSIEISQPCQIISDGSGTLQFKTGGDTSFTSCETTPSTHNDFNNDANKTPKATFQAIRIIGANNVVLRDFRLKMASEAPDVQPLIKGGIRIDSSTDVSIHGLELLGFPRAQGIVAVNSGSSVSIEDNLFHGSYTTSIARQVTAIEVDNDRASVNDTPVDSANLRIVGNFILGVMLDKGVFFDTFFRGTPLGYETDGINVMVNANPHLVANNSIMDVGEGIDTFASNGQYRNNHIERAFAYGLKVIHGASGNRFAGNRLLATGFSSIIVKHEDAEPTGSHVFVKNRIRYTNAFNVASLQPRLSSDPIAAVFLQGYTKRNSFHMNHISDPMFTRDEDLWGGGINCTWPGPPTAASNANASWKDRFDGIAPGRVFTSTNAECLNVNTDPPVLASTSYEQWIADGVSVETNARPDVFGEQNTVDRIWSNVSGTHDVRKSVSLGTWQNRNFVFSVLARRGTGSQLMLRDQVGNWSATFDLTGEGRLVSQSSPSIGTPSHPVIRDTSIVPLTDDWYFLRVNFWATGPNTLLTLRQLSSGPTVFLDLGEARLDR